MSDGSDRFDTARRAALQAQISSSEPDGAAFGDAPMPRAGTGLAADVDALLGAANEAQDKTGLDTSQIIHDYWLVRSLHGVAAKLGSAGEMARRSNDGRRTPVGRWAFGGGTSLTAAWQIGDRHSQDIDGSLFVEHDGISKSVRHRTCKEVLDAALAAIGPSQHITSGTQIRTTRVSLDGVANYLKFETSIQDVDSELVASIVEPRPIASIIAQHCDSIDPERFPELGGFVLLCVRPAWTAANKFDALHRRAAQGDLSGIRDRGRDLYDLWAIASSEHADHVRSEVRSLWERAASAIRAAVPRPDSGYGSTEVFTNGTSANEALRAGYTDAVNDTVWGDAPSFAEALTAARHLDT